MLGFSGFVHTTTVSLRQLRHTTFYTYRPIAFSHRADSCSPLLRLLGLGGYAHAVDVAGASLACPPLWADHTHATHPASLSVPGQVSQLGPSQLQADITSAEPQPSQQQQSQQQKVSSQAGPGMCLENGGVSCELARNTGGADAAHWRSQIAVACGDKTVRVLCGEWEVRELASGSGGKGAGGGGGGGGGGGDCSGDLEKGGLCVAKGDIGESEASASAAAAPGAAAGATPPTAASDVAAGGATADAVEPAASAPSRGPASGCSVACSAAAVTSTMSLWRNLSDQVLCVAHHPYDPRKARQLSQGL
jgi:hypothetical protein